LEEINTVVTCTNSVYDEMDLMVAQKRRRGGFSAAVAVSIVFHAFLIALLVRAYRNLPTTAQQDVPIARYISLIKQNPQDFVEAPGPAIERAPLTAPLSDANRKASMPKPTGDTPTNRPGDVPGLYTPPMSRGGERRSETPATPAEPAAAPVESTVSSRIPALRTEASSLTGINWRSAIKEVGQVASLNGEGLDLSGVAGGEQGSAETGPLSFETQWYEWGEYAQSMVAKIRVHWYEHMPMLIRTGMKGVVSIRFTIQRDGRITDITLLKSSEVPPYDFAARKAIELASPLNPLPKDFPNPFERVTATFYYNTEIPARR
jgi:TonB family protein